MRFAAIDIGSNASRLRIVSIERPTERSAERSAERYPGWKTLVAERVPLRLGHAVFQTGRLDPEMLEQAVSTLARFRSLMDAHEVKAYRAVVTASARDASNGGELLKRVRDEAGIELEAIDGIEEARIIGLAVNMKLRLKGHSLLMDIGGGSLELSEFIDLHPRYSASLPIGTVRFLEAFLRPNSAVSKSEAKLIKRSLSRLVSGAARNFLSRRFDRLIASGGNSETVAKLIGEGGEVPSFTLEAAEELLHKMAPMTPEARAAAYELNSDRADVIVPALFMLVHVARAIDVNVIDVPGVGIREGILRELIEAHYHLEDEVHPRETILASAVDLGERFGLEREHAEQVMRLAATLFDAIAERHKLTPRDRLLLELAAYLHDLGVVVNPVDHHKHSEYLIAHSNLLGITPEERALVSMLARFHRRSAPSDRHPGFRALNQEMQRKTRLLAGILRVADALDREHRSKIGAFKVKLKRDHLAMRAESERSLALERWALSRKSDVLEDALGVPVRLIE